MPPGTVILSHAIVNTDVVINRGCIINFGAIVDHGCIIEEVHIAPGAIVKGENRIEKCSKIEAGEVVERSRKNSRENKDERRIQFQVER